MIYVISDIHDCYEQYKQILYGIEFCEKDELYVLGDVIDRRNDPIKVLLDTMSRPNVFPITGNHERKAILSFKIKMGGPFLF